MLVCANGPFREFLEEHVPLVRNKFWPTLWCFESRAQTVIASVLRSRILPPIHYRRLVSLLLTFVDGTYASLIFFSDSFFARCINSCVIDNF